MARKDKDKRKRAASPDTPAEDREPHEGEEPLTGANDKEGPAAEDDSISLTKEEFEKTKQLLESLRNEKDDTIRLLQRTQADFDNYRRRNNDAKAESYEDGKRAVVKELLPVLDNFDRAMDADTTAAASWQDGVKMVYRQLFDVLSKLGLTEIDASAGFDPSLHNAVLSEKSDSAASGEILQVLQKGYRMGDAILRHTMVKVSE